MSTAKKTVTAAVIVIGNEILSGRTRDANLQFLAENLNKLGVQLTEARVIPDIEATIIDAVNEARVRFDYVFTTGGIGPTHDDVTSACIAKAFGVKLIRHPDADALLRSHYKPEDITDARMKMADVPEGAQLLENPVSKAPGYCLENVYVLPGVPRIMQAMFELFKYQLVGGAEVLSRSVASFTPEGKMAAPLSALQDAHPDLEMGSYPFIKDARGGSAIVIRGTDSASLDAAADAVRQIIRDLGGEPFDDDP